MKKHNRTIWSIVFVALLVATPAFAAGKKTSVLVLPVVPGDSVEVEVTERMDEKLGEAFKASTDYNVSAIADFEEEEGKASARKLMRCGDDTACIDKLLARSDYDVVIVAKAEKAGEKELDVQFTVLSIVEGTKKKVTQNCSTEKFGTKRAQVWSDEIFGKVAELSGGAAKDEPKKESAAEVKAREKAEKEKALAVAKQAALEKKQAEEAARKEALEKKRLEDEAKKAAAEEARLAALEKKRAQEIAAREAMEKKRAEEAAKKAEAEKQRVLVEKRAKAQAARKLADSARAQADAAEKAAVKAEEELAEAEGRAYKKPAEKAKAAEVATSEVAVKKDVKKRDLDEEEEEAVVPAKAEKEKDKGKDKGKEKAEKAKLEKAKRQADEDEDEDEEEEAPAPKPRKPVLPTKEEVLGNVSAAYLQFVAGDLNAALTQIAAASEKRCGCEADSEAYTLKAMLEAFSNIWKKIDKAGKDGDSKNIIANLDEMKTLERELAKTGKNLGIEKQSKFALEMNATFAKGYLFQARGQMKVFNYIGARDSLKKALEFDAKNGEAQTELDKMPENAKRLYNKAAGEVDYDPEAAIRELKQVIELVGGDSALGKQAKKKLSELEE